jgi:hypothetical protein
MDKMERDWVSEPTPYASLTELLVSDEDGKRWAARSSDRVEGRSARARPRVSDGKGRRSLSGKCQSWLD